MAIAAAGSYVKNQDTFTYISLSVQKIVIAGASGYLGQALQRKLAAQGCTLVVLSRSISASRQHTARHVLWDGVTVGTWSEEIEGSLAVINLAGHSINCRHTQRNKQLILSSRVNATRAIGQAIANCTQAPSLWINASGVHYYESRSDIINDEEHGRPGTHFLSAVCRRWEEEVQQWPTPRTRKVCLRTAMVWGPGPGNALTLLAKLARLGLGGRAGSGKQTVAWIHLDDFLSAVNFILQHPTLQGPVNMVAPRLVTNEDMMRLIRKAVGASWGVPAPAWLVRLGTWALNKPADLILTSTSAYPGRLLQEHFKFQFADPWQAISDVLGR